MAIPAHHFTLRLNIRDNWPGKLPHNSPNGEVSTWSWRVNYSWSQNYKSRICVQERPTFGADVDCRTVSRRPELVCSKANLGDLSSILLLRRIRAKGLDLGQKNGRHSLFGSSASEYIHGLSSRDEFSNPLRRRITTSGRRRMRVRVRAAADDPYDILGVSRTATEKEIKQAYRKLALKFHPDVNKEADAQKKFLQIKAAYQTLVDKKSGGKYNYRTRASPEWDPFTSETKRPSPGTPKDEEEFYRLGDFFKDIQISIEDFFRDLQADTRKKDRQDAKPKSLWEELTEIGEEFVEFLEKELNLTDSNDGDDKSSKYRSEYDAWDSKSKPSAEPDVSEEEKEKKKLASEIEEIEEMLAKIKKELGM